MVTANKSAEPPGLIAAGGCNFSNLQHFIPAEAGEDWNILNAAYVAFTAMIALHLQFLLPVHYYFGLLNPFVFYVTI
jgi:hypothetical protein